MGLRTVWLKGSDFMIHFVFVNTACRNRSEMYNFGMPKLWTNTVAAHRVEVREAILDATWALASERGPAQVTMSQVAERTGISRATLYKYFPSVQAILVAYHRRHIENHMEQLAKVRDQTRDPGRRLRVVLEAYARIHRHRVQHEREHTHGPELATLMHIDEEVGYAQQQLQVLLRNLIEEAVEHGIVRDDVGAAELASYCLHALVAAGSLKSDAGIQRLVDITMEGLCAER